MPQPEDPKAPEAPYVAPKPMYDLSAGEKGVMANYNTAMANAKIKVHDLLKEREALDSKIEAAEQDVHHYEQQMIGILSILGNSHGMQACKFTSDLTRIEPA
jgi:hypothetical protein